MAHSRALHLRLNTVQTLAWRRLSCICARHHLARHRASASRRHHYRLPPPPGMVAAGGISPSFSRATRAAEGSSAAASLAHNASAQRGSLAYISAAPLARAAWHDMYLWRATLRVSSPAYHNRWRAAGKYALMRTLRHDGAAMTTRVSSRAAPSHAGVFLRSAMPLAAASTARRAA